MDWSKAVSFHRLYGHEAFEKRVAKENKTSDWKNNICSAAKCRETSAALAARQRRTAMLQEGLR